MMLVGDLGRTQRPKLAELRRELDVGWQGPRWHGAVDLVGSVVGWGRNHAMVVVLVGRDEDGRSSVHVLLRVNVRL